MDQERISRNVVIANRSYPLKIYKKDEHKVIESVHQINQKIDALKSKYDAKDNQDYLAMCLLQIATQDRSHSVQNTSESRTQGESISNEDKELITEIDTLLSDVEII